jgi:hypothetical protein
MLPSSGSSIQIEPQRLRSLRLPRSQWHLSVSETGKNIRTLFFFPPRERKNVSRNFFLVASHFCGIEATPGTHLYCVTYIVGLESLVSHRLWICVSLTASVKPFSNTTRRQTKAWDVVHFFWNALSLHPVFHSRNLSFVLILMICKLCTLWRSVS